MRKLFTPQSAEWLEFRLNNITATEVGSLFGLDKYKSANKVFKDKVNPVSFPDNLAMRAGRLLESAVIEAVKEVGYNAVKAHEDKVVTLQSKKVKLSCSLDALIKTKTGDIVLECKTAKIDIFNTWEDMIPVKYYLQIQAQILLTDTKGGLIACLGGQYPDFPLVIYKVKADPELHRMMEEEVDRFWISAKEETFNFKYNKEYNQYIKDSQALYSTRL